MFMKIAHICPFYIPAICGVKQVVEELAKRQVKLGHEVHVFTSDWDKNKKIKKKEEVLDGINIHRCNSLFKFANFATFWPSVFFKILFREFDIIHSHLFGHPHFVFVALVSKLKGIPHIHTTHCPWTDSFRSTIGRIGLFISYNLFSRIAILFSKKIIAITPWEISFIKKYGGRKKQIEVIPNGMDKRFFNKVENNDFKIKNNISKKIILFFGRLNVTKSPDKFVEIAKIVLSKRKDVVFVLRGPDEGMKDKIKKMIENEKDIILLNETRDRNEIIKMYHSAEMYILPSYREGLPLTLFEAMASGLPILASPVNGVPFEIKDSENGFLINYGDINKYAEKVNELLDNPQLAKKFSENNLKKAKQYDWDI